MNKKLIVLITLCPLTPSIYSGNSIKERLSRLEAKVNTIIKNERNEWEAIKKLDIEIQQLEKECFEKNKTATITLVPAHNEIITDHGATMELQKIETRKTRNKRRLIDDENDDDEQQSITRRRKKTQ